jgi:hypothetical protein
LENSEVNQNPTASVPPLKIQTAGHPERWARSDKDKAELFAAHLWEVFTPNDSHPDQEIEDDINTLPLNIQTIEIFSTKEIKDEIGFLNIYIYIKKHPVLTKSPLK